MAGCTLEETQNYCHCWEWGKLVPIIAVMSGECHDIFNDKWGKPI